LCSGRVGRMVDGLVPDGLWEHIAPLIFVRPPRRQRFPGRKPVEDQVALVGIVYVLRKDVTWADVPAERIGCSGVTAGDAFRSESRPG
jgi:transposase